ncbi:MAG: cation-transporting P-type ATPase [Nitrospirae bacterium]|nr:cation-transporting P-type ATPase [Nitrospirota bacterium]
MPDFTYQDLNRLSINEVLTRLDTTRVGLSPDEAQRRLAQFGRNVLREPARYSLLRGLTRHFTHFLAVLLWVAALLSFAADFMKPGEGMATLGWAILGVIVINAAFAFLQEYKAERAVQALHRLLPDKAWVTRNGQSVEVSRSEIVPGDLLILEEGEKVPADARLIEATGMRVDNAALTGESKPKRRTADPAEDGHWLDIPNLVFAGTTILSGHGHAVAFATGMRSEFGKIANLTTTVEVSLSPLQKEIIKVTRIVAIISLAMGASFFVIGLWTGLGFWVSAIFGIGIIVANVPEGLLPTVTLALALSSQRMAKRHALIKQLSSVETLGCTTVICTDKTGTLTENRMKVDRFYADGLVIESREGCFFSRGRVISNTDARRWRSFFDVLLHCHNAKRVRQSDGRFVVTGDPTEVALLEFAVEHGLAHRPPLRRMGELAFDADRKRMSTLHWSEGRLVAFTKGAPESVLSICAKTQIHGEAIPMTRDERARILSQSRSFAEQAYRVLAVAIRDVAHQPKHIEVETIEEELTFLGLVAMMDPPHREVPDAIVKCRRAGVRVIMITGDHPLTALAIARKIGLMPGQATQPQAGFAPVIEGSQLDNMDDAQLRQLLTPARPGEFDPVFARMAPRHKLQVVSVLKEMGQVVAVTGDGVNDAPALKKANIGVAMGIAGTDVAKETADIILLDDNFATIVNAIEEGRTVFANIRKFATYVLVSNVPEVVPYLAYGFFGIPLALTIPQVLAVDLGTDMVPAIALGADPPQQGIMDIPPRPQSERLLTTPLLLRTYFFLGLNSAILAMGAFFFYLFAKGWTWGAPLDWSSTLYKEATTVTFAGIVLAQVANVFACRSDRHSTFTLGWFSNPLILWGIGIELLLLALITYTPIGNDIFGTSPLPVWIFGPLSLGALALLFADEGRKMFVTRFLHRRSGEAAQEAP